MVSYLCPSSHATQQLLPCFSIMVEIVSFSVFFVDATWIGQINLKMLAVKKGIAVPLKLELFHADRAQCQRTGC